MTNQVTHAPSGRAVEVICRGWTPRCGHHVRVRFLDDRSVAAAVAAASIFGIVTFHPEADPGHTPAERRAGQCASGVVGDVSVELTERPDGTTLVRVWDERDCVVFGPREVEKVER
jgi:hypothetical protein